MAADCGALLTSLPGVEAEHCDHVISVILVVPLLKNLFLVSNIDSHGTEEDHHISHWRRAKQTG